MIRTILMGCVIAAQLLSACAAHPTFVEGQSVVLLGKLVLKGSEPHTYPVLQMPNGIDWKLEGLTLPEASALQNRDLEVRGTVLQRSESGPKPASLWVEHYMQQD
ncbi:hypothetical protein R0381_000206 [Jeongeupia wiesaeckerbachi]|uniref:hypothetical protein n=1 Tax=Jeongeupia wiesaeckerbachi TaxID=3051218 RepID=UPI003D803A2C